MIYSNSFRRRSPSPPSLREARDYFATPVMTEKTPMLSLEGGTIVLSALKKAEKGKGMVVRLFNPQNHSAKCRLKCPALKIDSSLAFGAFECKTFRIDHDVFLECDMMEE